MPFKRETPDKIQRRQESEIEMALPGSNPRIPDTPESMISRSVSLAAYEMHGHIEEEAKEILPHTATRTLDQHADLRGLTRNDPNIATGGVTFSGEDGAVVPAGVILQRADGWQYELDNDVIIVGGTGVGVITAIIEGVSGNTPNASTLSFISPELSINTAVIVNASGLSGGADKENNDSFRSRILEQWRQPPHGGAIFDYIYWGKQVSGVTRVWAFEDLVTGIPVSVTFVMDNKTDDIIPTPTEVTAVYDHINKLRPVGARFEVFAPVELPVNIEVALNPNNVEVQASVQAEIEDFFQRESEPGKKLRLSRLQEAVSVATGEFFHELITPTTDINPTESQLPVIGTIIWSAAV